MHVSGSKGHLRVDDFVLPYPGGTAEYTVSNPEFVADGCRFTMEPHIRRGGGRRGRQQSPHGPGDGSCSANSRSWRFPGPLIRFGLRFR